jgi:hypothetical protein
MNLWWGLKQSFMRGFRRRKVLSYRKWLEERTMWPFPDPEPRQTPRGPDPTNQYGHLRNPN